jgi:hypothetical protein
MNRERNRKKPMQRKGNLRLENENKNKNTKMMVGESIDKFETLTKYQNTNGLED